MRAVTLEHGEVVTYAFDMLRADEQPAEDAQLVMGRPRYQARPVERTAAGADVADALLGAQRRAAEPERDAIVSLL